MINRIYRKDHFENIRIFRDIERKKKYSPYSIELNRVFGDKSYDNFFKNLTEDKKSKIDSFKQLFEKAKDEKDNFQHFNEKTFNKEAFKKALEEMKKKTAQKEYQLRNPYKTRIALNSLTSLKKNRFNTLSDGNLRNKKNRLLNHYKNNNTNKKDNKIYLPDVPDLGRYNPSYDFIRKHTYQASFTTKIFTEYNKKNNNMEDRLFGHKRTLTDINKNNKIKNIKKSKDTGFLTKISNVSKRNSDFNTSQTSKKNKSVDDVIENKRLLTMNYSPFKNNHCLKFENYSDRKPMITKYLYRTEKCYDPYKSPQTPSTNICIKFNKLSTSVNKEISYFDKIAQKNVNPPLGTYKPNYNAIFRNLTTNIYIDKKEPPPSKKIKLKKIMCSFNTPEKYQLFTSLNNKEKSE